jgi:hypothetical protein
MARINQKIRSPPKKRYFGYLMLQNYGYLRFWDRSTVHLNPPRTNDAVDGSTTGSNTSGSTYLLLYFEEIR